MKFLFRSKIAALGTLSAALTLASGIASSSASATLLSAAACDSATLTQPFKQFGDSSSYKLVPGGAFESGEAAWTLSQGAAVVSGSEPYGVTGKVGSRSLYLPAGASAESPPSCVTAAYPTLRMFGRNSSLLSTVVVQVVYTDPILGRVALPVGPVGLSTSWEPSLPLLTASAVEGVLKNGVAEVSVRVTALTSSTTIDDVYLDPRLSH